MLIIYTAAGSLGLTLMKKGMNNAGFSPALMKSPVLFTGFGLYGFSFILWLIILKENELSLAFPIASAALFIGITLFSSQLLHENINYTKIVGMVLIIIGIFVISRG